MMSDARGYVNARDQLDTYRAMVEDLRERDDLRNALDDAQSALDAWELDHESEYKRLFHEGAMRELDSLDAAWNELVAERDAARDALDAWELGGAR